MRSIFQKANAPRGSRYDWRLLCFLWLVHMARHPPRTQRPVPLGAVHQRLREQESCGMKCCTKCKQSKPESDFYGFKSGGLHSWCKACEIIISRERNARLRLDTRDIPKQYNGRRNKESVLKIRNTDLKNKSACSIIHSHHNMAKDDPEHLTTEFIQKIVGRKC